jgi:hypothetical protein
LLHFSKSGFSKIEVDLAQPLEKVALDFN